MSNRYCGKLRHPDWDESVEEAIRSLLIFANQERDWSEVWRLKFLKENGEHPDKADLESRERMTYVYDEKW